MVLSTRLKDERMAGRAEEREKRNHEIALKMLKEKYSLAQILTLSDLSKEEIYALAQANKLKVTE
ncbi:hypothetical protein [uncultured Phascolarctobacterium sp.]|uniref:hypothetical protein n=1 Tax=uncultured Phascolarctobacterium sp. TaxID=512296 RepID=UPI0025F15A35|nr:hypothetical protein [uncultured Phascolarctobacterium sp.]